MAQAQLQRCKAAAPAAGQRAPHRSGCAPCARQRRRAARRPLPPQRALGLAEAEAEAGLAGAALASSSAAGSHPNIAIESVTYDGEEFSCCGILTSAAPPELVYKALTDYGELARIFRNVATSEVHLLEGGQKQLVQECRWHFLLFRGTFRCVFEVEEEPEARRLTFNARSAFMRRFLGRWEVGPAAGGPPGSAARYSLTVAPALRPPKRVGELSKKIFVGQVESILEDLHKELERELQAQGPAATDVATAP